MGVDEAQLILDYVIDTKKSISLDIFEAEFYDAALVVQPLVGNLVYYSNLGKYEPRLAESWERISPNSWRFKVRSGLKCEDGEVIDAQSFKKSLERMILHSIKKGGSPIFSRLSGFSEFVRTGRTLDGIVAQDSFLYFNFDKPLSGGLVEVLSFAPYGYICAGNLTSDGQWKDPSKFISSGPYRITSFESGVRYQLELRSEWEMFARPRAPRLVNITQSIPASIVAGRSTVVDSHAALDPIPKGTEQFELVPEYLNAILLGNLDVGYFSLLQNRESFRGLIAKYRDRIPSKLGIHNRSSSFYSNVYAPRSEEHTSELQSRL